ncbi:MAG: sigma-70 family RNA polymerase sigma factor [Abditibacteriales bacterium]|nr:sigma-70 family RNA polymerase sigma factor [Abditibacteriales bacterium]MDW8367963.1 sigma-70 family RNA polymerase sigma factor [Abditibacteriales bacterium]
MVSDERLMERVKSGDAEAFDALWQRHGKAIFNFIYRFVGDRQEAEDLTQETFVRVLQNAPSFNSHQRWTTWVYHIATNLCIDTHRKAQHRQAVSLDECLGEDDQTLGDILPDPQANTEEMAQQRALRRDIRRAIRALPMEQRMVVLLSQYQGMTYQEIAEVMGCPLGTVKSRMHHALKALRAALKEWM